MATLYDIDMEAGNLSEWTATTTDGGDLSASAPAALAGTNYGMAALIDDTTAIYGSYTITLVGATAFRHRFYFDPNSLTMNSGSGGSFYLFRLATSSSPSNIHHIKAWWDGANYGVVCSAREDDGTTKDSSVYTFTDAPHYIECYLTRASSNVADDGECKLYIDNTLKATITAIDNYDAWGTVNAGIYGAVTAPPAGTSGTFYMDQIVANNDGGAIGPYVAPSAGALHHLVSPVRLGMLIRGGLAL